MNIPDVSDGIKQFLAKIPPGAIYSAILLLSCTGSFGLGIIAAKEMDMAGGEGKGFWIEEVSATSTLPAAVQSAVAPALEPEVADIPAGGQYVSSKSGTRYYLPWCSGAKQIKEENKVWFTTKEAAEAAGYTPAKNCKGI